STYPDLPADFTYLQVSAGQYHSLALGSDGNVYAWGSNSQGRLGDGTTSSRYTPVRVKTPDRKAYPDLPAEDTTVVWEPDSFGYTGQFPQIARRAGMTSFLSQKISWNDTTKFPHHTFDWQGIDGTAIFTHFPPMDTYAS
ncbi:alpha-mannosidase, partial [Bifidobacterium sp. H1HS16N]|nr:alpha-mannosidase [Bifidobacterium sp. H1HS16N]